MTAPFDETEFIDPDTLDQPASQTPGSPAVPRVPPRPEELASRLGETEQRLAELNRKKEELERERAAMEELRRRRREFETGREKLLGALPKAIALLEKAEFETRRRAEQMKRSLEDLRERLQAVEAIDENRWSEENHTVELSRALGVIEDARREWNAARLKWEFLDGNPEEAPTKATDAAKAPAWSELGFWELCRIGLAFSLPVAVVGLAAVVMLGLLLWRG